MHRTLSTTNNKQPDSSEPLDSLVTQHIVFYILLAIIQIQDTQEKRKQIYFLALTSTGWRDLMLAPLNTKLDIEKRVGIDSKLAIETLRHRLFASANLVTLRNGLVISEDYEPNLCNLICLPDTLISNIDKSVATDKPSPSSNSPAFRSKRCYAVGVYTVPGLDTTFESGSLQSNIFKVFEERKDAETYAKSFPDEIFGYSISPRVVEPIVIRPRKLSSGGIDYVHSVQFFNVGADEISISRSTTPPNTESSFKLIND
jgi:hypothetical protein